jgi:hypothetical protein
VLDGRRRVADATSSTEDGRTATRGRGARDAVEVHRDPVTPATR